MTTQLSLIHQHDHFIWIDSVTVRSEVLLVACEGSLFVVLALFVSLAKFLQPIIAASEFLWANYDS